MTTITNNPFIGPSPIFPRPPSIKPNKAAADLERAAADLERAAADIEKAAADIEKAAADLEKGSAKVAAKDVKDDDDADQQGSGCKWAQLAVIVSGIAGACFLASAGILPAYVLRSCAVAVAAFPVKIAISVIASKVFGIESKEDSEYGDMLKKASPINLCVITPIIEELFFRVIIQGALHAAFSYILPPVTVVVLGASLPAAALASIVTAGVIFGAVHASNHPDNPDVGVLQAVTCSISGIFVEGMLYHTFGFGASFLAHMVNNTIVTCLIQASETFSSKEEEPPVPARA